MNVPISESAPKAQIARFDDWHKVPFELAYLPSKDDELAWSLGPNFRPSPWQVPFLNGTMGPLYGRNSIQIENTIQCTPYVNACAREPMRAPTQFEWN